MIRGTIGRSVMTSKDDKATAPASGERVVRLSYWDALMAEGFVPVRLPKRMIVRDGHPEVPLNRYRKGQNKNESQ